MTPSKMTPSKIRQLRERRARLMVERANHMLWRAHTAPAVSTTTRAEFATANRAYTAAMHAVRNAWRT